MITTISAKESARLEALHSYKILDTPPEAPFDDLVELAARICDAPMAAVSLIDSDRQWFKARVGVTEHQTVRDVSFCTHGIAHEGDLFIVPDALLDERFAHSPLVRKDPYIRFYSGARLINGKGHALGMLCVMDQVPREINRWQQESLQILARQVVAQLELRRELAAHRASRKQLESSQRELRESEELYHSLVEHLPLFILRKDNQGRFTFANNRLCKAFHCLPGEVAGKTDFDVLPPNIAEKLRDDDQRVVTTGKVFERIEAIQDPDGHTIHVEIITAPLHDQDGKIAGVQVISRDITEQHELKLQLRTAYDEMEQRVRERTAELEAANDALKKAERLASEWKERYDLIVASSGLAVYDIDRATGEVVWGNGAQQMLGLQHCSWNRARDEWLALIHPQDRDAVKSGIEEAMGNGRSFEVQYRLRHGRDHYRWIRDCGVVVPDAHGRCIRVLGIMQDVTQRKLAEDTMREQAALLDQTQDAIMVRDLKNRVLYWNKTAEQQYGWKVGEALGKPIHELLLRGNLAHIPTAQTAALTKGKWSGEVKVFTKAGKELTVNSRWTLLCDRDGKPHAFLVAHTDLTEQKVLQEKFLRGQRLESLGALASGIAHDLNNVFTPILMSAQLLGDPLDDATRSNMTEILVKSARRGSDMVKQVLTFTRGLEGGRGLLQVNHLLNELEKLMRDTFPPDIKIKTNLASNLWPVQGDATHLYQVAINLCINARDAMPGGGALTLEASNVEFGPPADGAAQDGKHGPYVCIAVADNGSGMSAEVQQRIFEPFFTTKPVGKGTGLGLSTVMTLVQAHGGFVKVASEVGKGTCFKIFLPAECTQITESASTIKQPPDGHGELLLVVEDESAIREMVKTTLEAHDYEVLLAQEGTEALALYAPQWEKIALVITDIAMPVLDGHATIRALRKMNPEVKVIAVSGLMDPGKLDPSCEGSTTVLTKPYTPETLLNMIQAVLHPSAK